MSLPKPTTWDLDPHTEAKHEILRRYLGAWFPILGTYHGRIVYIDGFAGPGRYSRGELGSPLIALDVASGLPRPTNGEIVFWFIEERDDRLAHLQLEIGARQLPAHLTVSAEAGRFDQLFEAVLASIEGDGKSLAPTFAFIDPFGFSGIPFVLIERLLRHPRCEVLITFMVDAINRFLDHPDDKVVQHIRDAFGGDDAVAIARRGGDRIHQLRELYHNKLSAVARFVRYFEMRDANDRPQYYLFFATNHALGHVRMKEAMWKVDPEGAFRFSDATDPGQLVLLQADQTPVLAARLQGEFRGRDSVSGREVRAFVEERTPFLKKHMTCTLRREEEAGRLLVSELKQDGKKRRGYTYPDEVILKWA